MGNFISELKKIPSVFLIYKLSEMSIKMFQQKSVLFPVDGQEMHYGRIRTYKVSISPWDIPYIDYLSICNSNDYRNPTKSKKLSELLALYRDYENKHSAAEIISDSEFDGVMRVLTGMTAEQFLYEDMRWVFQSFNRNHHILVTLQKSMDVPLINVQEVVSNKFGITTDEYNIILLILMWLCSKHPDPLSAPEEIYKRYGFLSRENISRVVQYYSCNYKDIRTSSYQKQLFYSKPFIHTENPNMYIACTTHMVLMTMGTGLYWLIRDYYKDQSQVFINAFGSLFEEYVKNISSEMCRNGEFRILKTHPEEKSADFLYEFDEFIMIVEAKSTLLGIKAKQQVPELTAMNTFIDRTIKKAYNQLLASYNRIQSENLQPKPIIKIILLYDVFSNTALLEHSASSLFENDMSCFIMTIRELETLLLIYRDNRLIFKQVTSALLRNAQAEKLQNHSFTGLFSTYKLWDYNFFTGNRDYFHQMLGQLGSDTSNTENVTDTNGGNYWRRHPSFRRSIRCTEK